MFYYTYWGWREEGGEGSLPVHTCGRKARERTVQGGAAGFLKAFYTAVTPTEHRGQGGLFSLQTAKRSECCHGDRSQGFVVFLMKVEGFLLVFAEISTSCDPQE